MGRCFSPPFVSDIKTTKKMVSEFDRASLLLAGDRELKLHSEAFIFVKKSLEKMFPPLAFPASTPPLGRARRLPSSHVSSAPSSLAPSLPPSLTIQSAHRSRRSRPRRRPRVGARQRRRRWRRSIVIGGEDAGHDGRHRGGDIVPGVRGRLPPPRQPPPRRAPPRARPALHPPLRAHPHPRPGTTHDRTLTDRSNAATLL